MWVNNSIKYLTINGDIFDRNLRLLQDYEKNIEILIKEI